ncbi:MAG: 23S rRNA (uridine(2552)-2'-O)-methyltransferase RlmE [Kistimonas sp.]|nr:23S rRNA (uridine(2552)-2'-O)-methyltransferase RlmE [Kistimonas sp.]
MGRSKSSAGWLKEHFSDQYVQQGRQAGYRCRASYKLLEIASRDKLFSPGMTVVDLGAAPGGWSQVVAAQVGSRGRVLASDILPMEPLETVTFIQGDFTQEVVFEEILASLDGRSVDVLLSDMAPNMSGNKATDCFRAMELVELAVDMAEKTLRPGGSLLVKVFHGVGFDECLKGLRQVFSRVQIRKPQASRARSSETYLLCRDYRAGTV